MSPFYQRVDSPRLRGIGFVSGTAACLAAVFTGLDAMRHAATLSSLHRWFIPIALVLLLSEWLWLVAVRYRVKRSNRELDSTAVALIVHYERLFLSCAIALTMTFTVILDATSKLPVQK